MALDVTRTQATRSSAVTLTTAFVLVPTLVCAEKNWSSWVPVDGSAGEHSIEVRIAEDTWRYEGGQHQFDYEFRSGYAEEVMVVCELTMDRPKGTIKVKEHMRLAPGKTHRSWTIAKRIVTIKLLSLRAPSQSVASGIQARNAEMLLREWETKLIQAAVRLAAVLKSNVSVAERQFGMVLGDYSRALTDAQQKLKMLKELMGKVDQAGSETERVIGKAISDFEESRRRMENSYRILPPGLKEELVATPRNVEHGSCGPGQMPDVIDGNSGKSTCFQRIPCTSGEIDFANGEMRCKPGLGR